MAIHVSNLQQTYHVPGRDPVSVACPYVKVTGCSYGWQTKPTNQVSSIGFDPSRPMHEQPQIAAIPIPGTGHSRVFVAAAIFEGFRSREAAHANEPPLTPPYELPLFGQDALDLVARAEKGSLKAEWYKALQSRIEQIRAARGVHPFDGAEPVLES